MKIKLLLPLLFFCATVNANHSTTPALLPADRAVDGVAAPDTLEQLRALIGEGFEQPAFLDVDDAFQLEIKSIEPNRLETTFAIADGYYLYRDKIKFRSEHGVRVVDAALPPGEIKNDAYFGEIAVFKHDFSAPITLQRAGPATAAINVHATYQGCAEDGICYPPVTKIFSVELPQIIAGALAQSGDQQPARDNRTFAGAQFIRASVASTAVAGLPGILLGAFLAGLLLTFTPCVLPMLPILSGVIAGHGKKITRRKGGTLALAYVLGTMVTYAAIGALAGATGAQLQAYFQNIWAIGVLVAVLVVMALSMFGFFTLQVPSFIQAKWQSKTRSLGGSLPLVFVLGAVSAVIVGACVSPVLISFLGLAVSAGNPWLGAGMMMAMALGMGVPLLALGLGAGHWLPKAGQWMETVNRVFGVMLIGVAIYLLGALPGVPVLLLWGTFLIILGVYLGATRLSSSPANAGGGQRLIKGVGIVLLVWGVAALIGGFSGGRDLFKPLPAGLFTTVGTSSVTPDEARSLSLFTRVSNLAELDLEFARAAGDGKLVMLEYYADWCPDCARLEKTTFRDAGVRETLQKNFITLQVDVTDPRDADGKALKKRFGVFGPPAVLFFDRNGAPLADKHFYGYRNSTDFHALITALSR